MKATTTLTFASTLALITSLGCSSGGSGSDPETGTVTAPQCASSSYVAFDSANHANQDIRLAVHEEIVELLEDAAADLDSDKASDAADKIAEARDLYEDGSLSADFRTKVKSRVDEHLADEPSVGEQLDSTIVAWLDFAANASTALEASVAAEWVDKTIAEFLFLSVHHEMLEGTRENWDEGYGYYGSGPDNREGALLGFAAFALKSDGINGTNLEPTIYNNLIDGSCHIETALSDSGDDTLDMTAHDDLSDIVESIDMDMQRVLALSVGHEAYEMEEGLEADDPDTDAIIGETSELIPLFLPLERIMLERGGESAERAELIRELIDQMPLNDPENVDLDDTSWIDDLGDAPEQIIDALETEYDIEVKG